MALNYGTKWAIYMLLGKHTGTKGVQSKFRTTVGQYVDQQMSITDAVTKAAQEQIDPTIQAGDIQPLQTTTADDLRVALGLDDYYDPTQGDCPGGNTDSSGTVLDNQQAIANALVGMTGPVQPTNPTT